MAEIIKRNLPSDAIQADRLTWLTQVQRGERGDPALLLTGLSATDDERWEIGIADAWQRASDSSQIVLKLPKPAGHPESEAPWTEYWFDQETVWLLQAHILYGGRFGIYKSKAGKAANPGKPNGYYYPAIWVDGRKNYIPADRLIGNLGPRHDAHHVDGIDHHDHRRATIKPTSEWRVAAQVGRENERANLKAGKVTREGAIETSLNLWRECLLFPTLGQYRAALVDIYEVLDRRHPLAMRASTTA